MRKTKFPDFSMHMTTVNEFYSLMNNTHASAYTIPIQIYSTKLRRQSKFINTSSSSSSSSSSAAAAAAAARSLQGFRSRELFRSLSYTRSV
jgi:Asp-tRNA(Asn)/Glu-tRNA(Gln) amidotransferase A subunit family amidase